MKRYSTIYWATPELDAAAHEMAAADLDSLSRFVSKLVAKEADRRRRASELIDPPVEYRTEAQE